MQTVTCDIEVGSNLSADDLLSALQDQQSALFEVLVGDVTRFNLRADYTNDSLELLEVTPTGKKGVFSLRYSFGWEAYWGCRDMNDGDIVEDEIDFTYRNGYATFSREVVEQRNTVDEF